MQSWSDIRDKIVSMIVETDILTITPQRQNDPILGILENVQQQVDTTPHVYECTAPPQIPICGDIWINDDFTVYIWSCCLNNWTQIGALVNGMFDLDYDLNGGTPPIPNDEFESGTLIIPKQQGTDFNRTGYVFRWFERDDQPGIKILPGQSFYMPDHDLILKQVWGADTHLTVTQGVGGTQTGSASIFSGQQYPVSAAPSRDYIFNAWQGNGISYLLNGRYQQDNTFVCPTPSQDYDLVANFVPNTGSVTVNVNNSSFGNVSVSPSGQISPNVVVTITCTPAQGYDFGSFTGNNIDVLNINGNKQTLTMPDPQKNFTFTANFIQFEQGVIAESSEEIMNSGVILSPQDTYRLNMNQSVTLSATNIPWEYTFYRWHDQQQSAGGIITDAFAPVTQFTYSGNQGVLHRVQAIMKENFVPVTFKDTRSFGTYFDLTGNQPEVPDSTILQKVQNGQNLKQALGGFGPYPGIRQDQPKIFEKWTITDTRTNQSVNNINLFPNINATYPMILEAWWNDIPGKPNGNAVMEFYFNKYMLMNQQNFWENYTLMNNRNSTIEIDG